MWYAQVGKCDRSHLQVPPLALTLHTPLQVPFLALTPATCGGAFLSLDPSPLKVPFVAEGAFRSLDPSPL